MNEPKRRDEHHCHAHTQENLLRHARLIRMPRHVVFVFKPADSLAGPLNVAMRASCAIRILRDHQHRIAGGPEKCFTFL